MPITPGMLNMVSYGSSPECGISFGMTILWQPGMGLWRAIYFLFFATDSGFVWGSWLHDMLSCFSAILLFLLLCSHLLLCFSALLLLYFGATFTILPFASFSYVFLLLYFLLLCFSASCLYCLFLFIFFCFLLSCLYPKRNPRETLGEKETLQKS